MRRSRTFTPEGKFGSAIGHLPYLRELGITAIELMPIADFPGARNWRYDGVLPFAPDRAYGSPEQLKALVDAAHGHGLMVLLDVVDNHLGLGGNHVARHAPGFYTDEIHTPWGSAIDFREPTVRSFYIHNALFWLREYHFDGLRFDAVHAIVDPSDTHIMVEVARTVRAEIEREVHLILENEDNCDWWSAADLSMLEQAFDRAGEEAEPDVRQALDRLARLFAQGRTDQTAKNLQAFQQLSGPLMAKSVEDTVFYRCHRLLALNEVGGEPDGLGCRPEEFHRQAAARLQHSPDTMLCTATHDTSEAASAARPRR